MLYLLNWEKKTCPKSWFFASHIDYKLKFHQPINHEGKNSIFIPNSVHNEGILAWGDSLIGQLFGMAPALNRIQAVVNFL